MSPAFALVVAGVFGACVGSFLNVVIWRLPRGESVAKGRSHCPKCGRMIRWHDNVPVLSWLLLRARCRDCRAPISARYPFVEALTCVLFLLVAHRHPWPDQPALAATKAAVLAALVAVSFVDVDRREIPDAITKPGIAIGLLVSLLVPQLHSSTFLPGLANRHLASLLESAAGVATGAGSLLLVRWLGRLAMGKEAMGLGDVKLLAMLGAFMRPLDVLLVLLVASLAGSVVGGLYVLGRSRRLAPLAGRLACAGARHAFSLARIRAPRRAPVTVAPLLPRGAAGDVVPGRPCTVDLVLPAETVWSDDGKDVALSLAAVVERVEDHGDGVLATVRPEPLSDADDEWLSTFALHRVSIPFGVFLAIGGAAVLLYGDAIAHFVTVTWPRIVTRT
jgi:leader peptidase (prepilin peptidase) / N-methyltransferase